MTDAFLQSVENLIIQQSTGWTSANWKIICSSSPDSQLSNSKIWIFIAPGLTAASVQVETASRIRMHFIAATVQQMTTQIQTWGGVIYFTAWQPLLSHDLLHKLHYSVQARCREQRIAALPPNPLNQEDICITLSHFPIHITLTDCGPPLADREGSGGFSGGRKLTGVHWGGEDRTFQVMEKASKNGKQ